MAYRSSTYLNGATSTAANFSVPSGAATGDIAIVAIYSESSGTITPPSGFTQTYDSGVVAVYRLAVFWKRLTAADTGTYNFTTSTSAWREGTCSLYSGRISSGDPFTAWSNATPTSATSIVTPAITAATNDDLVGVATCFNGGSWTAPSGMTERQDTGAEMTLDTQDAVTAGSTGTKTFTYSGGASGMKGFLGALAVAGGGGSSVTGDAALSGTGSTTADGSVASSRTVSLAATAAITVVASLGVSTGATLSGTGSIAAAGQVGKSTTSSLSGTGTITADGQVTKAAGATLAGTGTITASGTLGATASATLTGTGSITADGTTTGSGRSASLAGTGTITAAGSVGTSASATITGTGSITATGSKGVSATASINGAGTIAAAPGVNATATLNGTGSITAAGQRGVTGFLNPPVASAERTRIHRAENRAHIVTPENRTHVVPAENRERP